MISEDVRKLRLKLGNEIGLGGWFGGWDGDVAALDPADRLRLYNAVGAYVRANPMAFTPQQRAIGERMQYGEPTEYSLAEMAADFFGEMGNQAQAINPLSEQNRGGFAVALVLVALVGVGVWAYAKGMQGGALK